jgi:hypothetical protein
MEGVQTNMRVKELKKSNERCINKHEGERAQKVL